MDNSEFHLNTKEKKTENMNLGSWMTFFFMGNEKWKRGSKFDFEKLKYIVTRNENKRV